MLMGFGQPQNRFAAIRGDLRFQLFNMNFDFDDGQGLDRTHERILLERDDFNP
jgi:hypothetical protein